MSTTAQIYEEQNPRQYTDVEKQEFGKAQEAMKEQNYDWWTVDGIRKNTVVIHQHFNKVENRNTPLTFASVVHFVNSIAAQRRFATVTPAQKEFYALEKTQAAVDAVNAYLQKQGGRPGTLSNQGDALYQNATALLKQLNGRQDIDSVILDRMAQQIQNKPGSKLVWLKMEKAPNPYQHRAEDTADQGERTKWTPLQYRKAEEKRLADEEAAKQKKATEQKGDDFYAFGISRLLNHGGRNHAEGASLQEIHDKMKNKGASPREIYFALEAECRFYDRRAQLSHSVAPATLKARTS
jgi:hypothetical protein